jgi:adenine-specific DNA-methyltransferase
MTKDIEKNNERVAINDIEIAVLKEHFPACFKKDGSFDIERFKEELKDKVDVVHEGYELKFLGKSYSKLLASLDTTTVITPNTVHNNLPENKNSENIYISGDNLDGLKHLLKSYSKAVKCIYIDPPYNTGNDGFVYKDNFNFTADELQDKLSVDETQANRIIDLTKRKSASHSAWLMFMYARLQLAKDLLADDGVIFISIDDNEQANLKLLCDDVFGEENIIEQLIWKCRAGGGADSKFFSNDHEYILCYSRNANLVSRLFTDYTEEQLKKFQYKDDKGYYFIKTLEMPEALGKRPNLQYPIEAPDGTIIQTKRENTNYTWVISKTEFLKYKEKNLIEYKKTNDKWMVYRKYHIENEDGETRKTKPRSIIDKIALTANGSKELKILFDTDNKLFDNPKPVNLVKYLLNILSSKEDIILDFFSGSATTAHSTMELNSVDNGNRKFITVQLPEILDANNPTQKTAYDFLSSINSPTTLDYIGIERIKRAAKKIRIEKPNLFNEVGNLKGDYGFKHFILNEPNQNTLDKCDTFDKAGLLGDATILDDFGAETILTTWLNNDGYGLNAKVQTIDLNGYEAYYCNKHLYLIHPDFNQNSVVALFEKYDTISSFNPENIVLFGYSFIEWSISEMLEKNLKILNDSEKNLKINIDVRY